MAKEDKQAYIYTENGTDYSVPSEKIGRLDSNEKNQIIHWIINYGVPANDAEWVQLFTSFTDNKNAEKMDKDHQLGAKIKSWAEAFIRSNTRALGFNENGEALDDKGRVIKDAKGNPIKFSDYQTGNYFGGDSYDYTQEKDENGNPKYRDYYDYLNSLPQEEQDKLQQEQLQDVQDTAYNNYWNNLYQKDRDGTLGYEAYQNMLAGEQAAGQSAIDLANAQAQQLGLAQAQTVKNITDQLKAERMSMLRAGMSESQIASQDMQNMIANTNALNEQIAASNMAALQGQQQVNNAQYAAYQNWLNAMNQTGTNASAMAAADAGNAIMMGKQYDKLTNKQKTGVAVMTNPKQDTLNKQ